MLDTTAPMGTRQPRRGTAAGTVTRTEASALTGVDSHAMRLDRRLADGDHVDQYADPAFATMSAIV